MNNDCRVSRYSPCVLVKVNWLAAQCDLKRAGVSGNAAVLSTYRVVRFVEDDCSVTWSGGCGIFIPYLAW